MNNTIKIKPRMMTSMNPIAGVCLAVCRVLFTRAFMFLPFTMPLASRFYHRVLDRLHRPITKRTVVRITRIGERLYLVKQFKNICLKYVPNCYILIFVSTTMPWLLIDLREVCLYD